MARKPPARVRAGLRRMPRPYDRSPRQVVPGISAPTQRLIADFERTRASPGAVAVAVVSWSRAVYSRRTLEPGTPLIDDCPCCTVDYGRDVIEQVLRTLPRPAARELRAVVQPLDEAFLARVRPDPNWNDRQDWWRYLT